MQCILFNKFGLLLLLLITADGAYHCPVGSIMAIFYLSLRANLHSPSLCQGRVRPAADSIERVSDGGNVSRTETAGREEESWCMKARGGRTQT